MNIDQLIVQPRDQADARRCIAGDNRRSSDAIRTSVRLYASGVISGPVDNPPQRRERIDAVRNRERVLRAAEKLFAERGFAGVLMEDVARGRRRQGNAVPALRRSRRARRRAARRQRAATARRSAPRAASARSRCCATRAPRRLPPRARGTDRGEPRPRTRLRDRPPRRPLPPRRVRRLATARPRPRRAGQPTPGRRMARRRPPRPAGRRPVPPPAPRARHERDAHRRGPGDARPQRAPRSPAIDRRAYAPPHPGLPRVGRCGWRVSTEVGLSGGLRRRGPYYAAVSQRLLLLAASFRASRVATTDMRRAADGRWAARILRGGRGRGRVGHHGRRRRGEQDSAMIAAAKPPRTSAQVKAMSSVW